LGEGLEAAVVGSLDLVGEAAGGKLPGRQMIAQAITAGSFSAAAGIRAVAVLQISLFAAFHIQFCPYFLTG
jgi:hypothetical protein